MELELDRDGPSNDERALRLEQERTRELGRELELQQETINLDRGLEKVDALSDMPLQCLYETELDFIKREISEFAFIKTGSPANIQELEYDPDRNLVLARCNGRSLQVELDKEGFEKPIEVREKLSKLQTLEQAHQQLEKNVGHLEDMVRIAIDQHNKDTLMQEIKIEQASQGLIGVWNKLTGQIPEPYPSLYEKPLTHDDLARSLLIADVKTESFQQLLDNQMPDIRRYPQQIDEQLDRVVEQSREHLETFKLETAAMVVGHELERNTNQPEIEPQLERSMEERPIVNERQQDARQEDLNPILNHDDRELSRQEKLELSQEKIDDIREIYVNRIHEVNQELSDINAARQVDGYWDQSQEIIRADTDRADLLLSQRLNLYEILDRTPDEQQAYLDQHPEFDLVLNERDYDKVQVALDDLSENMPKPISLKDNPDDYKVGVWDSVKESIGDTFVQAKDGIYDSFTTVDNRIESGESANSNYSALGLTEQQIDQYVQEKFAEGQSAEWIGLKLAATNVLYNSWNSITWGALKENDMLAVRHADGEISESEMENRQYLNGGIAAAFTLTAGAGVYSRALATVSDVSIKVHIAGAGVGFVTNTGMQYAINGDVDMASAITATTVGFILPAYGYKGLVGVSSIGTYVDNAILHDKTLVDTGYAVGLNVAASTVGYGISYLAMNNKYTMPYLSQTYRNNLYGNGGHNYIHNYTTFRQSEVFSKATIVADGLGNIGTESINQGLSKGNKNEK